VQTAGKLGQ